MFDHMLAQSIMLVPLLTSGLPQRARFLFFMNDSHMDNKTNLKWGRNVAGRLTLERERE